MPEDKVIASAEGNQVQLKLGDKILMRTRWNGDNPEALAQKQCNEINTTLQEHGIAVIGDNPASVEVPALPEDVRVILVVKPGQEYKEIKSWMDGQGLSPEDVGIAEIEESAIPTDMAADLQAAYDDDEEETED